MKRRRKGELISSQQQTFVVGNSGKINRNNRLCRLRMSKKYKDFLREQEHEKNAKISEMSSLVEQLENLSYLVCSLEQENANSLNAYLLQELEETKKENEERLRNLKSMFMDDIPDPLNRSIEKILNCNSKQEEREKVTLRSSKRSASKAERNHHINKLSRMDTANIADDNDQKKYKSSVSEMGNNIPSPSVSRYSWCGSYKSQIFVRKSNSQLQPINIDLFSLGKNLYDVLAQELEEDVTNYNLTFGAKEVNKEQTLFEQEIYHGSTVDLIMPLCGGMERGNKAKRKRKSNKKNEKAKKPAEETPTLADDSVNAEDKTVRPKPKVESESLTKVQEWFVKSTEILEIDILDVSNLMSSDVKTLNLLEKEDWKREIPVYGHILFNMWQKDKSGLEEEHDEAERASLTKQEQDNEMVPDTSLNSEDSNQNLGPWNRSPSTSSRKMLFGKSGALEEIGNSYSVEDFENNNKPLSDGNVVTITGVCSSPPRIQGNAATLFVRDDPQGAVGFYNELKVVVRGSKNNMREVSALSKEIVGNMHVGMKGRVQKLQKEDFVRRDGFKMIQFKLIVDSDDHVVFSVATQRQKLTRQLSQHWWPLDAWCEDTHELKLKVGDYIVDNDLERVYCDANVSDKQILEYVVAFKNSCDGEIFVGVEKDGKVTGIEVDDGKIKNRCEDLSKAIAKLLPESINGADICRNIQEAKDSYHRNRCFVHAIALCNDNNRKIVWIHVRHGEAKVYFTKPSDVHAYKRVGAENKLIENYEHLFYDLESLAYRKIEPVYEEDYDEKDDEDDDEKSKGQGKKQSYSVLEKVENENQNQELKMIFGDDPLKTIKEKYLAPHACGFLNSDGGNIFFGIEEDQKSKLGHIVGIVLSKEEREDLLETTVKTLRNFYPPVSRSQFRIKFHTVRVPSWSLVNDKTASKLYTMIIGPGDKIGKKWPKFLRSKLPESRSATVPIRAQRFCVVASKKTSESGNLRELVEKFVKDNSEFKLQTIDERKLKSFLKDLCVVQLKVERSPYPMHMIKTIDTFVFTKDQGKTKLCLDDLMHRFELRSCEFEVDKFLKDVKNFNNAGNSYILVASPFELPEKERDLYGLVIPKWTLAIDFDQQPKKTGHLFQMFYELNDRYQTSRNRFLKTPFNPKLELNPDHAVCWLAARGYREEENTLSGESHAKWNKTHRSRVRELLNEELKTNVKPNCLNVLVLWGEGQQALVESLRTILEDIISLNGDDSTVITFVCATPKASSDVTKKIIEPLQEDNLDTISTTRVHVASPNDLARFLSLNLPSPYRPEDDYQVPHKKAFSNGGSQIVPQVLPQRLRQNLAGYIDVMYVKKEKKPDEETLRKQRRDFFSGSAIKREGLNGNIAIRRTAMDDLEKEFKALSSVKKSHVSLIFVRVERGAGSTTMCLQFLYKQHRSFPCAQLIELKSGLEIHIEEMNKKTRLPLILFVDENIAHLQEFLEFKKKVERRNVNVIFILIEPTEVFSGEKSLISRKSSTLPQKSRPKSARDSSLYGPSPYKVVRLGRVLDESEMKQLIDALTAVAKGKKNNLLRFKEESTKNNSPQSSRTFAQFSLVAFGSEFKGLQRYVEFRLNRADERQKNILAFLSLTHVFTDYWLPANALVRFLDKRNVVLENEFEDKYLKELLSPPEEGSDVRRISFHEVASEILKQLSKTFDKSEGDQYLNYIKYISVAMAKHVLSKYITTKKIDRLTRKLFVTSEYESEKFSQLIRTMRFKNRDTARDTLKELVDVFDEREKHSSIRAHLRAHLAKYHMIEYKNFTEAKKLIEAAIREQEQDSLLHHIHGDIIRLNVLDLLDKMKTKEDMETIVTYAVQSSRCFEFVRSKRPHMSHGYISDAMVRIHVMKAGIKLKGGRNTSFVDYVIERINEIKKCEDDDISPNSRYILSLISDAHEYLDERCIDYDQKENWKETFLNCIGELKNLTKLCDKIVKEKDCSPFNHFPAWVREILVQTQILHTALEIENKDLSPEEIESKLEKMEQYGSHSKLGDRFMKFWIRYSRQRLSVPSLQEVKTRVYEWSTRMKKKRIASPQAEFYNFVVHVLMALKYPSDREKMDAAEKFTKRQQSKKYNKKEDFVLPLEWLHPKQGRHIESIDCLLHHDDLIKGTHISSKSDKRKPIEGSLFEQNITQWEGTITAVRSDWQGIITFKNRLPVRFVPLNAQPSMPSLGDTVKFCLSFDGFGLNAWRVIREVEIPPCDLSDIVKRGDDSSSENTDEEDEQEHFRVAPSLSSMYIQEPDEMQDRNNNTNERSLAETISKKNSKWDKYNGKRMLGIVTFTNPENGFGFIENADVKDKLFFHPAQLRVPVKNLEGNIDKDMLLDFKVEKLTDRTRAADIRVVKDPKLRESMLEKLRIKNEPSPPTSVHENESDKSRQEGHVVKFDGDRGFGFIKADNDKSGEDIFFSRRDLTTRGQLPKVRDRVEFSVTKDIVDGRKKAIDIFVQNRQTSHHTWDAYVGAGIQEGFVQSTTDDGGTIKSSKVTGTKNYLQFRNRDIIGNSKGIVLGTKVHFEVLRRKGRCFAVKIYVVSTPEEVPQTESGEASFPSNDF